MSEGGHLWEMPKLFIHEEFTDLDSAIFIDIDAVVVSDVSMTCEVMDKLKREGKYAAYVPEVEQKKIWKKYFLH